MILIQAVKTIWDKVFKSGPSKISGGQPLKNLKGMVCLLSTLGPLLNTLSHIKFKSQIIDFEPRVIKLK